jgi:DNA-binding CsgD family transcriptional regulator
VVTELVAALRGRISLLAELDWDAGQGYMVTGVPDWLSQAPMDSLISTYMYQHPLMQQYATGSVPRIARTLDEVAGPDWYRSEAFAAWRGAIGITRQLALPLRCPAGKIRTLIVGRPGRNFSERDQHYARRLQPILNALDAHLAQHRHYRQALPDPGQHSDPSQFGLTQRELVVLAMLAEGLTAQAIAHRLAISPHTVIKHQQNIYRKLRTKDRLTTVLIAQKEGLLPRCGA